MLRRLLVRLFRRIVGTLMHPTSLIPKPTKMRFLHWMANKRLLVSLYYMWTGEFANEQRAVFCGQLAQWDSELDSTRYELTRSIHRIEKGLITQPRKPVFAENYIARAVQDYARLREVGHIQDHATWARDVLNVYFDAVTDTPKIKRARAEFVAIEGCENSQLAKGNDERSRVPAPRQVQHPSVAIEDLDKLAKSRHSIRKFLPKSVPREALDRAVEVARFSPSACNRQPFEFRIFDEPDLVTTVASVPMRTKGFVDTFPCIVVVIGHLRAFPLTRDRHLIYIDSALASMAFELAIQSQGLDSCSINWPDIPEKESEIASILGLTTNERVIMLIAVGYGDNEAKVPFSQKKSLSEIRTFNKSAESVSSKTTSG